MGKTSGTQKSTVTNVTQLPQWYESAAQSAIGNANIAAQNIAKPYLGNTVAPLDPLTQQAIGLAGQNMGASNAAFQQAGQTAADVANYDYLGNVDKYMNPYIKNVEEAALGNMRQAYQQGLNVIGDRAINAGALGGSRQGVAEGVAASEMSRQMGDLSAQLRSQGYGQAMDAMTREQAMRLQAAQQQGAIAQQQQIMYMQSIQAALAAGQINQAQAQALLQQAEAQYNAMRNVPLEQLNIQLAALGGTQVPTSSSQTSKTPTSGNFLTGALGGALTGAQIGAAIPVVGPIIGALGGGLAGGFAASDERLKTNIQPLGIDGMTGMPIYAYDYKDDVAQAKASGAPMPPKRVGPMAQDIERANPNAVGSVGGMKVIRNLGFGM